MIWAITEGLTGFRSSVEMEGFHGRGAIQIGLSGRMEMCQVKVGRVSQVEERDRGIWGHLKYFNLRDIVQLWA